MTGNQTTKNLSPHARRTLSEMAGGRDWTHWIGDGGQVRVFMSLERRGLVEKVPHMGWCKGDCSTHWKLTSTGEAAAATLPLSSDTGNRRIWDGQ